MFKFIFFLLTLSMSSRAFAQVPDARWSEDTIRFELTRYHTDTTLEAYLMADQCCQVTVVNIHIEGGAEWNETLALPIMMNPSDIVTVPITFVTRDTNRHTARIIAVLDNGKMDTLILDGQGRRVNRGVYWDRSAIYFSSPECSVPDITSWIELNLDAFADAMIDSVAIGGSDAAHFRITASSPPNRLRNYILTPGEPGEGIKYQIEFDPKGTKDPRYGYLLAHTATGSLDTLHIFANVRSPLMQDIDTTLQGLAIGVDHVLHFNAQNLGEGAFFSGSTYFDGELSAVINEPNFSKLIPPGAPKQFGVTIRSDEAGTKTKRFLINGKCDDEFEIKITASFGTSDVRQQATRQTRVTQIGDAIVIEQSEMVALNYQVVDVTGREILSGAASNDHVIHVQHLPLGVYLLLIERNLARPFKFMVH